MVLNLFPFEAHPANVISYDVTCKIYRQLLTFCAKWPNTVAKLFPIILVTHAKTYVSILNFIKAYIVRVTIMHIQDVACSNTAHESDYFYSFVLFSLLALVQQLGWC